MVIERYLPIWGGAENQLAQLVHALSIIGVQTEIVTRRWSERMPRSERLGGAVVRRLGWPGVSKVATVMFVLSLTMDLLRRSFRFDVVHAHGAIKLGALAAAIGRLTRRPTVAKIATAGHVAMLRRSITGRALLAQFKRTDAAICMTGEIRQELEAIGYDPARIATIGNGVDTNRFSPESPAARRIWRLEHGLPPDALVAVFAGRFVKRKGIDVLLEAWDRIDAVHCNAQLFLLGSGDGQRDSVEASIRHAVESRPIANVTFAGPVPDPERYLNYADLFLFASQREGYPNALLEAMAAGTAVVATEIGGCVDLVKSGDTGLLVERDNPAALTEALHRLIFDASLREQLQQAARRQVEDTNAIEAIAARYGELYAKLATK